MDEMIVPKPEGCNVRRHLDRDLMDSVRGLTSVERAVRTYHRHLEENDWPDWIALVPDDVRKMLLGAGPDTDDNRRSRP